MNTTETANLTSVTNVSVQPSLLQLAENYAFYQAGILIDKYWFPILVPIGFIGNSLSAAVMLMKNNRKLSTCTYMLGISINDNILMIIFFYQWLLKNTQMQQLTDLLCKIMATSIFTFVYFGSYQVVLMTFDKCFAVMAPLKSLSHCTSRRACISQIIAFVCVLVFNSPHLYLSKQVVSDCAGFAVKGVMAQIYYYLSFIATALVPLFSLTIMNAVIIRSVRKSIKMQKNSSGNLPNIETPNVTSMKRAENQLTLMLVVTAVVYVLLFLPSYIRFIVYQFVSPSESPATFAGFVFFVHFSFKLYATNNGIHFFLYLVSGRKFRQDLMALFGFHQENSKNFKATNQSNSQNSRTSNIELSVLELGQRSEQNVD